MIIFCLNILKSKKKKDSEIQYISLYKDKTSIIKCEVEKEFELLEHNANYGYFSSTVQRGNRGGASVKVIPESDMRFGQFEEMNLFHIENSQLYEKMGSGIKTVEFILRYNENSIIFLEAKKSCPNSEQ